MRKRFQLYVAVFVFFLLLLPLFMGSCVRFGTCHQAIKVVNNSDSTISIRDLAMSQKNGVVYVWLYDSGRSVAPQETVTVEVIIRRCLEDYHNDPLLYYVLPEGYPSIKTSPDSLYIVYDILKTIDLQELGVDSLLKTDYTVYYP